MARAKDIIVRVITSKIGNEFVKRNHYSGKVVTNSQLHFGVFLNGRLHGVMQFGPPLDKRKVLPLVKGTLWNEMLELNRMAFDDALPKNSESRAIGVAMRLIRKNAPHIKWVLSFADGTQCGDGTIYRASGFVLTAIKTNSTLGVLDGKVISDFTLEKGTHILNNNGKAKAPKDFKYLDGYQLRYIYFLNPAERANLTVPILPFDEIDRKGAGMYKGQKRVASIENDASDIQSEEGGANPTATLQPSNK